MLVLQGPFRSETGRTEPPAGRRCAACRLPGQSCTALAQRIDAAGAAPASVWPVDRGLAQAAQHGGRDLGGALGVGVEQVVEVALCQRRHLRKAHEAHVEVLDQRVGKREEVRPGLDSSASRAACASKLAENASLTPCFQRLAARDSGFDESEVDGETE